MKLNDMIVSLRKKNGLSQEDLAEQIGVSRQSVSKWELGDSVPDIDKLVALSDLFDISLDELLQRERIVKINKDESTITKKNSLSKIIATVVTVAIMFGVIGFVIGTKIEKNNSINQLLNNVAVNSFYAEKKGDGSTYLFECVPSIVDENLSYEFQMLDVSNTGFNKLIPLGTTLKDGTLNATAFCKKWHNYDVFLTITNGKQKINIKIVTMLSISENSLTWIPLY